MKKKIDELIILSLESIKKMCSNRLYKYPFDNTNMCEGCDFNTVKTSKRKNHCQLSALFGNLSARPCVWNMKHIKNIVEEKEALSERKKRQVSFEEAITILKDQVSFGVCVYDEDGSELEETYDMAIKALNKQIPKPVFLEGDGYADGQPVYDIAVCPECGYVIDDDYDQNVRYGRFCPCCGQAIKWPNEGEKLKDDE